MNNRESINGKGSIERDPDLVAAMKRAAFKARMRAKDAGACVVIWENGHIIEDCKDVEITR